MIPFIRSAKLIVGLVITYLLSALWNMINKTHTRIATENTATIIPIFPDPDSSFLLLFAWAALFPVLEPVDAGVWITLQ